MKVKRNDPKPVPPPAPTFDLLGLTEVEATVMAAVMAKIGGVPSTSYRQHADTVYNKLREAGVDYDRANGSLIGNLFFENVEDPLALEPE